MRACALELLDLTSALMAGNSEKKIPRSYHRHTKTVQQSEQPQAKKRGRPAKATDQKLPVEPKVAACELRL